MHDCVFCEEKFEKLLTLVSHLIEAHRWVVVPIGAANERRCFKVYAASNAYRGGVDRKILCFCGERFTQNTIEVTDHLFNTSAVFCRLETNSFLTHLIREKSLAAHLQRVRDEALLDRVAGKKAAHGAP